MCSLLSVLIMKTPHRLATETERQVFNVLMIFASPVAVVYALWIAHH